MTDRNSFIGVHLVSTSEITEELVQAVRARERVRLAYERQTDGVISVHEIAPIDIRNGDTDRTASNLYLWAWCFDSSQAEMHLMHRVRKIIRTGKPFLPSDVISAWPIKRWPLPAHWRIPRDW